MVLDLNGVLVHRGGYIAGRERFVHLRPGCTAFLDWLSSRAVLSFWSSIADRNVRRVVDAALQFTSLKREDVQVLSQHHCTLSSYVDASNPEKPLFLKNLELYAKMLGLETVEDVLLVDRVVYCVVTDPVVSQRHDKISMMTARHRDGPCRYRDGGSKWHNFTIT